MGARDHVSHEEFVQGQRQWALAIATAILDSQVGPTAGSRLLTRCRGSLGLSESDEFNMYKVFIGVDSQTDHLPMGREREVWAPKALERADAEIAECDALFGAQVREACRELIGVMTPLVPVRVEELDVVETLVDVYDGCYIPEGSRGAVVSVFIDPSLAYLVEICDENGVTLALPTLRPHQVKVVREASSQ